MRAQVLLRMVTLMGLGSVHAGENVFPESKAKVDILLALPGYIHWATPESESGRSEPFSIGVLGASNLEVPLAEACRSRKVRGRTATIRYVEHIEDLAQCQMVFLRSADAQRLPEILTILRDHPVLTVSDTAYFAAGGVMVNLVVEQRRIGLVINRKAMKRAGLEASGHLLRLAQLVE